MKTLISEYAGIVLMVLVGLAVVGIMLFASGQGKGILGIAGDVINVQTKVSMQEQEYTAYDTFLKQEPLKITYVENYPIYAEEIIVIEEHFSVTDSKGNPVSYEVADVYDNTGNSCYEQVKSDENKLQFSLPGVYQILIQTKKENGKNVSAFIAFPVKGSVIE